MTTRRTTRPGGFTLMEVLVALTILSICVGLFMCSIGGSLRLRGRVLDRRGQIWRMRHAAEEAFLGLLEARPSDQGKTEAGVTWRTWQPADEPGADPLQGDGLDAVVLYEVAAAGQTIHSAFVDEEEAKPATATGPDREPAAPHGGKADDKELQPKAGSSEKK